MAKKAKTKKINPALNNAQIELKLSKIETVLYLFRTYLITSQPQEDSLNMIFDHLREMLEGIAYDVANAGHSEDCPYWDRIWDAIDTIDTAIIGHVNRAEV